MTIETQIREYTCGLTSDEVAYLIKDDVQISAKCLEPSNDGTHAEAILQMLKDGWTAVPF